MTLSGRFRPARSRSGNPTARELGFDFSGVDAPKKDGDYYGLRYAEFVVPLVKAVQEQQKMIEDLRAELRALKAKDGR